MERCRGDLLRWSSRGKKKKKWNIFPVVWTTHRAGFWDETPGSPRLQRERERRGERGVEQRARKKQSKTERQKRAEQWLKKRRRWREMKREEWKKDPCVLIWYPTVCASVRCHDIHASGDVIELSVRLKSPVHVWPKEKTTAACREDRTEQEESGERQQAAALVPQEKVIWPWGPSLHAWSSIISHPPWPPSLLPVLEAESSGNHSPGTCDTF